MPDTPGAEPTDPEIEAVLEGRDSIALDADLIAESAVVVRTEALVTRIRRMVVPARVKLALRGNKEARQILARDPVKLVQVCVLKNPRVSLEEALAMAKNRSASLEILRVIADRREWMRQYAMRLALVQNPKTPLPIALGMLSSLQERDVRALAKSKNVSSVLQAQARRILARKPER